MVKSHHLTIISRSLVLSLPHHPQAIPKSYGEEELGGLSVIPHFTMSDLKEKQNNDASIRGIVNQMELGEKPPPTAKRELPELGLLLREWNKLILKEGVLYRTRRGCTNTISARATPRTKTPCPKKLA